MKKFYSIFAVAVLLLMVGCKAKVAPVLDQAKADYAVALEEVGIPALTAFYEIEMQLDKPVSAIAKDEDIQLQNALTVIAAGNSRVKFIDRTYDKKGRIVSEDVDYGHGDWLGDCKMALDSLVLDLPDAIQRLKEANQVLPDGDKVTLRQPLSPPFRAQYIFGTVGTFFVSVDAITGEVTLFGEDDEALVESKLGEAVETEEAEATE